MRRTVGRRFTSLGLCAAALISGRAGQVWAQPPDNPLPEPVAKEPARVDVTLRVLKADGTPLALGNISIAKLHSHEKHFSQGVIKPAVGQAGPDTDANGIYHAMTIEPGRYSLYVRAPGQGMAVVPEVSLEAGNAGPIEVRLQPEGSLRVSAHALGVAPGAGRGAQDVPVGGAHLFLMPQDADELVREGQREFQLDLEWFLPVEQSHRMTRDGDGLLELSGLRPGLYWATLILRGYTVKPGNAVQSIEIKAGQATVLDLGLEPHASGPLQLRIVDKHGAPRPGEQMEILLQPQSAEESKVKLPSLVATAALARMKAWIPTPIYMIRRARTDKDGQISLYPIPIGRWTASLQGYFAPPAQVEVTAVGAQATITVGDNPPVSSNEVEAAAIVEK